MKYGRYEVMKEIGRGSMGVVYLAHDPNLDLNVALKVLRHDRVESSAFVKRFLSEAKALGRLDHPNIIRVFNVDEDEGNVYIAMEFIEGESLNDVIKKNRFGPEKIIELGTAVAGTLDYAHKQGIVHRDIKPSNILVRSDGRMKITDFGIAHIEDASAQKQTQAGEILGTPSYMSPEQVLSQPVDGRSDIFSLGIILYELCTGTMPFKGQNLAAIFNAITQVEPLPVTELNPDIHKDLSDVISRCLKKNPGDRFASGENVVIALKECKKTEELGATIIASPEHKQSKKHGLLAIAAVIIAVLIGVFFYFSMNPETESPETEQPPVKEQAIMALLKVESTPVGAQVFIDGTFKGITPASLELLTGKHEVRLTSPEHYDWEAQVQLKKDGETPLFVRLIPADGGVIPGAEPDIPKRQ